MISLGAFGVLLDCWALGMCRSVCVALVVIALSIVFGVQDLEYFVLANDVLLLSSSHEVGAD